MNTNGTQIELNGNTFTLRLDTERGLRAVSWENKLTGKTLALGDEPEFECDLDAAEERISITGWRGIKSQDGACEPNRERGFRGGFADPKFDDAKWQGMTSPACRWYDKEPAYYWARTHVFLAERSRDKKLTLVLGGVGLFDFRFMRVFVNGHEIGVREARKRWNEPKAFDLGAGSEAHRHLRFGQDNIIALQLTEPVNRTTRLDECDPHKGRNLPQHIKWPAQFEQYLAVGESPAQTSWSVARRSDERPGEVAVHLEDKERGLEAVVTYRWKMDEPTLHKFVEVTNRSKEPVRLLNVRLGAYRTGANVSEGEQGFPVYLENQFFMTLAHPSGWAMGEAGEVRLRQFPGKLLQPGETFSCMESVLGVAASGAARPSFLTHVRSRMRRTVRGHDKAYAILGVFGSWHCDESRFFDLEPTDKFLIKQFKHIAESFKKSNCRFDMYELEFWLDKAGDITYPDRKRFPEGFKNIKREIKKLGMSLALWIDSSWTAWSIGQNPVTAPSVGHDPVYSSELHFLCQATDPINTMYSTGLRHHMRENDARCFKFDNFASICYNPNHCHLPGIYSTEAIQNGISRVFRDLDRESPDVMLMLYWGYRSPWWLVVADTLFECGLEIEASHPGDSPTLYIRDSITQGLDQGQWYAEDIPLLGKDSLGIWLSNWGWNSSVGTERWQEGFVMDMCRGSLLAQPWSDEKWLNPAGRRQMAEFIALLKAQPACFANPRFILGNPWHNEPYGYHCTDGRRAFVALNNCTWNDVVLDLPPLPKGDRKGSSLYRWYPDPAKLEGDSTKIALRPFQIVLLEVVPPGEAPSLPRSFASKPIPQSFAESSRTLPVTTRKHAPALKLPIEEEASADKPIPELAPKRTAQARGRAPFSRHGGILVVTAKLHKGDASHSINRLGKYFAAKATLGGRAVSCEPVVRRNTYPASWQAWRIAVPASDRDRDWTLVVTAMLPRDVKVDWSSYFVPEDRS
jgi:hypothetical protein